MRTLWREALERRQIPLYLFAVVLGVLFAVAWPGRMPTGLINPVIAAMLYLTFLQVPLRELRQAWAHGRFLLSLGIANFLLLPLLVWGLSTVLPAAHPHADVLRLGVMLVLLAPCVDYVVTFAHLGRANARLLLAATPLLLLAQMLLLPLYLRVLLGDAAAAWVQPGPFLEAFLLLIALPLLLAALTQWVAARWQDAAAPAVESLGVLPVPATALLLFVVVAALLPQLGPAGSAVWRVVPLYVAFACIAPALGWGVARVLRLPVAASRAVAFSAGTRNSLVVLPLALAVPGAGAVLSAVVLAQTLVELLAELVYVRVIARWGEQRRPRASSG